MITVEEALQRVMRLGGVTPAETVFLEEADGRVLAGDLVGEGSLPPFDNSAMDGYALRAEDSAQAGEQDPVRLGVIGEIAAGGNGEIVVGKGECVRIFTGAPMPRGADAVVMQEDVRVEGGCAVVRERVRPLENVRLAGEDVKSGDVVLKSGTLLGPGQLSLAAALGIGNVAVRERPRVGVLSTGEELRGPGTPLKPGEIYESNSAGLAALIKRHGGEVKRFGTVRDREEEIGEALGRALAECRVVLTTGGVSVGEHDLVSKVFCGLGGRVEFWKVAMKPGKPVVFGQLNDCLFFGLPGNPVSAVVSFVVLVAPLLRKMLGLPGEVAGWRGRLSEAISNPGDRRHFMGIRYEREGKVRLAGVQRSHVLSSLAAADGLVDVPAGARWGEGTGVNVLPLV